MPYRLLNKKTFIQAFFYGLVGAIATAGDWGTFYLVNSCLGLNYFVGVACSLMIGATLNYVLNKHITFHSRPDHLGKQIASFIGVNLIALALSSGWMWLFVEQVGFEPMLSRICTTGVMYLVNFLMMKFLVFAK